jgi:hypothetical protein
MLGLLPLAAPLTVWAMTKRLRVLFIPAMNSGAGAASNSVSEGNQAYLRFWRIGPLFVFPVTDQAEWQLNYQGQR